MMCVSVVNNLMIIGITRVNGFNVDYVVVVRFPLKIKLYYGFQTLFYEMSTWVVL